MSVHYSIITTTLYLLLHFNKSTAKVALTFLGLLLTLTANVNVHFLLQLLPHSVSCLRELAGTYPQVLCRPNILVIPQR